MSSPPPGSLCELLNSTEDFILSCWWGWLADCCRKPTLPLWWFSSIWHILYFCLERLLPSEWWLWWFECGCFLLNMRVMQPHKPNRVPVQNPMNISTIEEPSLSEKWTSHVNFYPTSLTEFLHVSVKNFEFKF